MGRLLLTLLLTILSLTSCASCTSTSKDIVTLEPIEELAKQKLYTSVAIIQSTPGAKGHKTLGGTAFAITEHLFATAGHVCKPIAEAQKLRTAGITVNLIGANPDGSWRPPIVGSILDYNYNKDVCIVASPLHGFTPLPLADSLDFVEIETGDRVSSVGAPGLEFPVYEEGTVVQIVALNFMDTERYKRIKPMLIRMCFDKGGSGSPIVWNGKVIGIAVAIPLTPKDMVLVVPVGILSAFIDEHIN